MLNNAKVLVSTCNLERGTDLDVWYICLLHNVPFNACVIITMLI